MRETKITFAASFSAGPWAHRNVSSSMWELCTTRFRQKKCPNSETGGALAPRSVFSFRRSSRTSILLSMLIRTSCSSPRLKTSGPISTSSLNTRFVAPQHVCLMTIFRSVVWLHESAGISKSLAPTLISFFVLAQEWRKSIRVCFWWTWRACASLFSTRQSQYHSTLSSGTKISCFRSTTETRKTCMAIRIWSTRRFITIQGRFWIIFSRLSKKISSFMIFNNCCYFSETHVVNRSKSSYISCHVDGIIITSSALTRKVKEAAQKLMRWALQLPMEMRRNVYSNIYANSAWLQNKFFWKQQKDVL